MQHDKRPMTHRDIMGPITWADVTTYAESKGLDPQETMNAMHFWLKVGRLSSSIMNRGVRKVYAGYHSCPLCKHKITISWDSGHKTWIPEEHVCPQARDKVG